MTDRPLPPVPTQTNVEAVDPPQPEVSLEDMTTDAQTGEEQPVLPTVEGAAAAEPADGQVAVGEREEGAEGTGETKEGGDDTGDKTKSQKKKRREPTRVEAATAIQTMYRIRKSKKILRAVVCSVFTKVWDKWSESYFYKDLRTGETSWDKPELMGTEDLPRYGLCRAFSSFVVSLFSTLFPNNLNLLALSSFANAPCLQYQSPYYSQDRPPSWRTWFWQDWTHSIR